MIFRNVPGVFVEEISLLPPSVAGVETGIPAFIGYTKKILGPKGEDLLFKPTRLNSLRDYEGLYGQGLPEDDLTVTITDYVTADQKTVLQQVIEAGFDNTTNSKGHPSKNNMYYALQFYFANGGGPCYVVSVGESSDVLKVADLVSGLTALEAEDEPTMIVFPEAIGLVDIPTDATKPVVATDYFDLYNKALAQAADLKDRVVILDVPLTDRGISHDISTLFRSDTGLMVDNLKFGAAYYPYLQTTVDFDYTGKEGSVNIVHNTIKPDNTAGAAGAYDGKTLENIALGSGGVVKDNLLYNSIKGKLAQIPMTMPPSAAIAGVYARVDSERGVWKAPANVGIAAISGPTIKVPDADQNYMNIDPGSGKSVNAIRAIAGRGTVVWGARTLDGNSNEWRYISVRRFFNFVEESVKKATYRFVFEPNDANTWVKVQAMIENFLTLQWRAGALQGAKPEQAFFVRVGMPATMSYIDVLEGRMIVEIGMAVVRPAEFIILRFSHKMAEA